MPVVSKDNDGDQNSSGSQNSTQDIKGGQYTLVNNDAIFTTTTTTATTTTAILTPIASNSNCNNSSLRNIKIEQTQQQSHPSAYSSGVAEASQPQQREFEKNHTKKTNTQTNQTDCNFTSGSMNTSTKITHTSIITTSKAGFQYTDDEHEKDQEQQSVQLHSNSETTKLVPSLLSSSSSLSSPSPSPLSTFNIPTEQPKQKNRIVNETLSNSSGIQSDKIQVSNIPSTYLKNSSNNKTSVKVNKYKLSNNNSNNSSLQAVVNLNSNPVSGVKHKMVAVQDINDTITKEFDFNPSEELQYGPGIVSKLKNRFLTLTLRQGNGKTRLPIDNLRRATSLNNLIDDDNEDDHGRHEDNDNNHHHHHHHHHHYAIHNHVVDHEIIKTTATATATATATTTNDKHNDDITYTNIATVNKTNTSLLTKSDVVINSSSLTAIKPDENEVLYTTQKLLQNSDKEKHNSSFVPATDQKPQLQQQQQPQQQQYSRHRTSVRQIKRGNDSLKRARSVEALLCDKSAWGMGITGINTDISRLSLNTNAKSQISSPTSPGCDVSIEDKISNARERMANNSEKKPPKRLTSIIDETERPPPDLVKQTLKIFEASSNRRGRNQSRKTGGGEVATKIANYTSIISQEKPPISLGKPTVSPRTSALRKPSNLEISIAKKISSNGSSSKVIHPSSPISTIAKKFAGNDYSSNELSPVASLSPSPIGYNIIDLKPTHRQKPESTPIRNVVDLTTMVSPHTPDVVPRNHVLGSFDTNHVDSPLTDLTKKIEQLNINSPSIVDDLISVKRISKTALDNIANAGTTQHFSFQTKTPHQSSTSKITFDKLNSTGSTLKSGVTSSGVNSTTMSTKQIGVIRPLVAEPKVIADNKNNKHFMDAVNTDKNSTGLEEFHHDNLTKLNINTNNLPNNSLDVNLKNNLTSREIEKNLINEKKNVEAAELSESVVNKDKDNTPTVDNHDSPVWVGGGKKKTKAPLSTQIDNNTMVFNFKDRKEVPDYIENDGLLFRKRRELPKPNESGFVLLGDLSLETSTDSDEWDMGPPSPCDVEFENANILIDGKSSIRNRSKEMNLRVKFNDTLTSTFEYPSELSILEDLSMDGSFSNSMDVQDSHVFVEEVIPLPRSLGNLSLGSSTLGSYTPVAQIQNKFELGVTRSPNTSYNDLNIPNVLKSSENGKLSGNDPQISEVNNQNSDYEDDNSIQYLKPASDDLTVAYSEGIQKTDILF